MFICSRKSYSLSVAFCYKSRVLREHFTWEQDTDQYEELFQQITGIKK